MSNRFPISLTSEHVAAGQTADLSPLGDGLLTIAAAARSGVRPGVILDLIGWTTDFPLSCAETGRRHGLSRERVRQMEAAFLRSFAENAPSAWNAVVARVKQTVPLSRTSLGDMCRNEGLCRGDEYPWGLLALLARRGFLGEMEAVAHGRRGLLGDDVQTDRFLRVAHSIESRLCRRGVLDVRPLVSSCPAEMADELFAIFEDGNGPAVRNDGIWMISADREWTGRGFGLSIAKMFSVAERLDAKEMAAALARGPRTRCESFPEEVVGRMAIASGVAALDEDGLYRRVETNLSHVLAPAERHLVDVLRDMGGSGTRSEIIAACERNGLNATTVNLYLSWAPFLLRAGAGVYELVGAGKCVGRTADRENCVAFRKEVTSSTLRNGVVNLPSACRGAAPGKVVCIDMNGRALGHIRIGEAAISGLRRHLRRMACAAGQTIVIEFDRHLGKATLGIEGVPA